MRPVILLSSWTSSLLLLGLIVFVMLTLGRKHRTSGLILVGLLGVLACGTFLFIGARQRADVLQRDERFFRQSQERQVVAAPRLSQSILIVDLSDDALDDEDATREELASLAHELCKLERRHGGESPLGEVESLPLGDDRPPLGELARVSRVKIDGAAGSPTRHVVRFRCPENEDWVEDLADYLRQEGPGAEDFNYSSHDLDQGVLDLVLDAPGRRVDGRKLAHAALESWERAFREIRQADRDGDSELQAAHAAFEEALSESARVASEAIEENAREAQEAVAESLEAAKEAAGPRDTAQQDTAQQDPAPQDPAPQAAETPEASSAASSAAAAAPDSPEPAERPKWVDQPRESKTEAGYERHLIAGPAGSLAECESQLAGQIRTAVDHYVNTLLGDPAASEIVRIPNSYIADRILRDQWTESLEIESLDPKLVASETEAGQMLALHARLVFDDSVRRDVEATWRDYRVRGRLWAAGVGTAGVLGVLGVLYGYLRFDTATKGYYSGRLKLASFAAILAVIALAVSALAIVAKSGIGPR